MYFTFILFFDWFPHRVFYFILFFDWFPYRVFYFVLFFDWFPYCVIRPRTLLGNHHGVTFFNFLWFPGCNARRCRCACVLLADTWLRSDNASPSRVREPSRYRFWCHSRQRPLTASSPPSSSAGLQVARGQQNSYRGNKGHSFVVHTKPSSNGKHERPVQSTSQIKLQSNLPLFLLDNQIQDNYSSRGRIGVK